MVDISNLENPTFVWGINTGDWTSKVCVASGFAFAANNSKLWMLDISNPANPFPIFNINMHDRINDLFASGAHVYIAHGSSGFSILNFGDPRYPFIECTYDTPSSPVGIFATDNYFYVDGCDSLLIFSNSDLSNPILLGGMELPPCLSNIYVNGDYAYMSSSADFLIANVSDPENPYQCSYYEISSEIEESDLWVAGHYAFVAAGYTGLVVFDISNPMIPRMAAFYKTPAIAQGLFIEDNDILLADFTSFMTLRFNPETESIDDQKELPENIILIQSYPNPFNAQTTISYNLSQSGPVTLSIYNLLGQKMTTLSQGIEQAGEHKAVWDATAFPSGVYFARLEAGEKSQNIKMVLLK